MRVDRLVHVLVDIREDILGLVLAGQPLVVGDLRDVVRDACRHLADPGERRVNPTALQVRFGDQVGERVRGREEHLVRDDPRTAHDRPEPDTREYIGSVALSRDEDLVVVLDRIERAAAGKYCAPLAPFVRLSRGAFGL